MEEPTLKPWVDPGRLETWVHSLGFHWNPFQYFEASGDPNLIYYFVDPENVLRTTTALAPALIFAQPGGGKTATRIYTARQCWGKSKTQLQIPHPFPIQYVLSNQSNTGQPPTLEQHLCGLAEAGAAALLLGLAFRPKKFTDLDQTTQITLASLLNATLPRSLVHSVTALKESGTPLILDTMFDRAYILPDPPTTEDLRKFCNAFIAVLPDDSSTFAPTPAHFEQLVNMLLGPLGFNSVFLLLDGVDAFPETQTDTNIAVEWIAPLFEQVETWASQKVFIKSFLPLDTAVTLIHRMPVVAASMRQSHLNWSPDTLADVLRRRALKASKGTIDSLQAISSMGLLDVDNTLSNNIPPLPREAIVLAGKVLEYYGRRTAGFSGSLEESDVEAALTWYQAQSIIPLA